MSTKVARSAAWVLFDNAGAIVVSIGTLVVMARLLGPTEFAVAALALTVVQILWPLADGAFHDVIVQRRRLGPKHVASAWILSMGVGAILAVACLFLAAPLAALLGLPDLAVVLPVMGLSLVLAGGTGVPAAFARRRGRFRTLALRTVAARMIGGAAGVSVAFAGGGAWSIVAQHLSAGLVSAALLLTMSPTPLRAGFSLSKLRDLWWFATMSIGEAMLWAANARVATLLVGVFLGPTAAAQWNVAQRMVEPLQGVAGSIASHVGLPLLARRQADPVALKLGFLKATGVVALMALPAFIGLAMCAPEVVAVAFGPAWGEAAPVLVVFAVMASFSFVRQFGPIVITAVGRPGSNLQVSMVSFAAGATGVLIGAQYGLVWAAAGALLRPVAAMVVGTLMVRSRVGIPVRDQLRPAAGPLAAALLMALGILVARMMLPPVGGVYVTLGLLVGLGVLVYVAAAIALARGPLSTAAAAIGWRGFPFSGRLRPG